MKHDIILKGYGAFMPTTPSKMLCLGTAESYGIEQLNIIPGAGWEGLVIKATFHPASSEPVVMVVGENGGVIDVPPEATAKATAESSPGVIVFSGVADGVQRISANLAYTVIGHASVDGKDSEPTPSQWEQLVAQYQSKVDKQQGAENAGKFLAVGENGGVALSEGVKPEQIAAAVDAYLDENPIEAGATEEEAAQIRQNKTDIETLQKDKLSASELDSAVNSALAQAKASGEFDGKDGDPFTYEDFTEEQLAALKGKDGDDYVLTEADKTEIAEQAAQLVKVPEVEIPTALPNPHALTFTGAVDGTYDGSAPLTVEIPEGGGNVEIPDEQIENAVNAWLDEHPEATTTVADGSVTPAKTDFLETMTVAEPIIPTLTADGYLTHRTDYIDVSGNKSLYVRITGFKDSNPDIHLEGSNADKAVVLSKTLLDSKEIRRIKYTADGTIHTYTIDVPALGEFSFVRLWIGTIKNTETEYKVSVYYSKEDADRLYGFVKLSDKYNMHVVEDGSISLRHTDFASYVNPSIMDYTNIQWTGYNTDEHLNQFGVAHQPYFADYLEVNENHELYFRAPTLGYGNWFMKKLVCYDADKNVLPDETHSETLIWDLTGDAINKTLITLDDGREVAGVRVLRVTVSENTKYVRWMEQYIDRHMYDFIIVSKEDIPNLTAVPEKHTMIVPDEFKRLTKTSLYGGKGYSAVFIGDSLTNWGGGNAKTGFLRIVHDKTGIGVKNEGYTGATWQDNDQQPNSAVKRVNTIIAENRKYSMYCFIMGTNGGSNTDTGETSADTSTMCGAIRYCLETLKSYDPTAFILVCLPPQRAEGNENQEKVNAVIKAIAESYGVRTLDIYHHSGIVPNTKIANVGYLYDGLHLGENGIHMLGNALASEIKYMLCL